MSVKWIEKGAGNMLLSQKEERKLKFKFHGKILDHFGIQAYQSPVAAIAELVSNAWDADAESVWVSLPESLNPESEIKIRDNGNGMTFSECQDKYLKIGFNRRGEEAISKTEVKHRIVLGRKGIGKFAGFGIAKEIVVETISGENGQKTSFVMNLEDLRGEDFILNEKLLDATVEELGENGRKDKGSTITLRKLTLNRNIPHTTFPASLSRRFLLYQAASDFHIFVNNTEIADSIDWAKIQLVFPRDYESSEIYTALTKLEEGWGREKLSDGNEIIWRVIFYKEPIEEQENHGISIFSHGKLAQKPFLFNLTGGMYAQAGIQYMSGTIVADYVDEFKADLISTERQRINFDIPETEPLQEWGQKKIKELLPIWNERRGREREKLLEEKISKIGEKIQQFEPSEQKVIKRVVKKIASVPNLKEEQFIDLSVAIVSAWESGHLKELITQISEVPNLSEADLLSILLESEALTALEISQVAKTRRDTIQGLKERVKNRELENAVRNYISENPWLIAPQWETFRVEKGVRSIIQAAASVAGLDKPEYAGRVDLVLSSGQQLLVLEFMRPGLRVDWDHVNRFERYVLEIKTRVEANTSQDQFRHVQGYLIADGIEGTDAMIKKVNELKKSDMWCTDWNKLIDASTQRWSDFLEILAERGAKSNRIKELMSL